MPERVRRTSRCRGGQVGWQRAEPPCGAVWPGRAGAGGPGGGRIIKKAGTDRVSTHKRCRFSCQQAHRIPHARGSAGPRQRHPLGGQGDVHGARRPPASWGRSVLRSAVPAWGVCAEGCHIRALAPKPGERGGGWGAHRSMPGWFRGLAAVGPPVRCRVTGSRRCGISWEGAGSGKRKRKRVRMLSQFGPAYHWPRRSPWASASLKSSAGSCRCSQGGAYITGRPPGLWGHNALGCRAGAWVGGASSQCGAGNTAGGGRGRARCSPPHRYG